MQRAQWRGPSLGHSFSSSLSLSLSCLLSLALSCLLLYHGRGVSFRLLEVGTWYRRATALIRSTLARTVHAGASDRGNAAVPRAVHDCDPFPGQPSPLTFFFCCLIDASLLQQAAALTADRLLQDYRDALVAVEAAALREGSTPLGIVLDSIVPVRSKAQRPLRSWRLNRDCPCRPPIPPRPAPPCPCPPRPASPRPRPCPAPASSRFV